MKSYKKLLKTNKLKALGKQQYVKVKSQGQLFNLIQYNIS